MFRVSTYSSAKHTMVIDGKRVKGNVCEYICNKESDIDKLPKVGIPGTQENSEFDNLPCWYGSIATVCTGTLTAMYALTPDNVWTKM